MDYLPIFVDLKHQPVLVVGGGEIALRKIRLLLDAKAQVTIVALKLNLDLEELVNSQGLVWFEGRFHKNQVFGMKLVIAATDDVLTNQEVYEASEEQGILVNVVDNKPLCRFIFPAIVDRSPLMIAISSGGHAPVLARKTRAQLEQQLPQSLAQLGRLAQENRDKVKKYLPDVNQRRGFWEDVILGKVSDLIECDKLIEAQSVFNKQLKNYTPKTGFVSIVGAGPGDPELLTLKALRIIQRADVIVHDGLVTNEILDLSRRDATRISVAKQAGNHTMKQADINKLLVKLAKEDLQVCRLKGGDPFIYGRGGEECQELQKEGIDYQVVPGITAALGGSAYSGIPLTHRDYANSVQIITGHCQEKAQENDWKIWAKAKQTLVVYMGLGKSEHLTRNLILHGRDGSTPIAIIEKATQADQKVLVNSLDNLSETIKENKVQSPAIIIVGEVCELASQLAWRGDAIFDLTENDNDEKQQDKHTPRTA